MKNIRILIEIPEKWVDFESPLGLISMSVKQMVEREIHDALVKHYIKRVKLPKIKISTKDLKEKILDKMAENAINKG